MQTARDRINARHDCELQALENFRAYVRKRAKADGEYAATLAKIQGHTLREMAGLGTDSPIVQVSEVCVNRNSEFTRSIFCDRKLCLK